MLNSQINWKNIAISFLCCLSLLIPFTILNNTKQSLNKEIDNLLVNKYENINTNLGVVELIDGDFADNFENHNYNLVKYGLLKFNAPKEGNYIFTLEYINITNFGISSTKTLTLPPFHCSKGENKLPLVNLIVVKRYDDNVINTITNLHIKSIQYIK